MHRARRALLRCVTGAASSTRSERCAWGQRMHSSVNFQDGAQISSLPELAIFEESDEVIRRRTLAKKNRDRRLQQQNSIDRSPSLGKTVQGRARRPSMMKSVASPSSPQRQPRAPDGFASSAQARRLKSEAGSSSSYLALRRYYREQRSPQRVKPKLKTRSRDHTRR